MRGLLTPSLQAGENSEQSTETPDASERLGVSATDRPYFDAVVTSMGQTRLPNRRWSAATDLTVTAPELRQIEELADLLGATPRTVKRFVNVYLLVKSMGRSQGRPVPDGGQVALLLALATTMPELTDALVPALRVAAPRLPLESALRAGSLSDPAGEQHTKLTAWLEAHPGWKEVDMSGHDRWIEIILRFTFGRRGTAIPMAPVAPAPDPPE